MPVASGFQNKLRANALRCSVTPVMRFILTSFQHVEHYAYSDSD